MSNFLRANMLLPNGKNDSQLTNSRRKNRKPTKYFGSNVKALSLSLSPMGENNTTTVPSVADITTASSRNSRSDELNFIYMAIVLGFILIPLLLFCACWIISICNKCRREVSNGSPYPEEIELTTTCRSYTSNADEGIKPKNIYHHRHTQRSVPENLNRETFRFIAAPHTLSQPPEQRLLYARGDLKHFQRNDSLEYSTSIPKLQMINEFEFGVDVDETMERKIRSSSLSQCKRQMELATGMDKKSRSLSISIPTSLSTPTINKSQSGAHERDKSKCPCGRSSAIIASQKMSTVAVENKYEGIYPISPTFSHMSFMYNGTPAAKTFYQPPSG